MKEQKGIRENIKSGFLPVLMITLMAVAACVGLGTSSEGKAAPSGSQIWHDGSAQEPALLPKGFQPLPSLSGLVKKLQPAVVNVYTTQVIKPKRQKSPQFGEQNPFEEFFGGRNPFGLFEQFHSFQFPQREFKRNSLGSGFIVSEDGYILTNHHVVANATEIKVKLSDDHEKALDAKVVGSDQKTDLALLKVEPGKKLPYVLLGDSDKLEVGDWVVAIGNPYGLGHTVTTGIISGKDREIGQGPYDDFLQTDAAINPGNSGGPLFDTAGNVVGINTAIIPQGSGIGFAVPVNLAKSLLPQLRSKGKVTRGWLGVGIQNLTPELAENFGVGGKNGVLISQVYDDSPAAKAGLQSGDIIVSINGKKVDEMRQVTTRIAALEPGSSAKIEVVRNGHNKSFKVVLGEREKGEAQAIGSNAPAQDETSMGLTLTPLNPDLAHKLGVDDDLKGLVVKEVAPDSPAAGILRQGDVVLEVNRKRVTNIPDFRSALSSRGKDKGVLMRVQRGNAQLFMVISK